MFARVLASAGAAAAVRITCSRARNGNYDPPKREGEAGRERERGECIRTRYYNAPESRLIDCDFGEGYKGFLYRENNGGSCVVLCARKRDLRRGSKAGRENSKCELRKIIGAFRGKCPEFKAICKGMNGGGIGFRFEWFIHIRCNKGSLREL